MIRQSDIAGGQSSGSAGWEPTTTLDCTAEGSADWTSGSGYSIGGVAVTVTNGGNASTFGPDGSTGIVDHTNGVQNWTGSARAAPCLSVAPNAMLAGVAAGQKIGIGADVASPTDHSVSGDFYTVALESDPSLASAWAIRVRYLGDGTVQAQALSGGTVTTTSTTSVSDLRRIVILVDYQTGYAACYYSTTATDGNAPPWAALTVANGWTRLDTAPTRLIADNAAQFDPTTDVITIAAATSEVSGCGITTQYIHAARYGSA